jgi:hypothetical protein
MWGLVSPRRSQPEAHRPGCCTVTSQVQKWREPITAVNPARVRRQYLSRVLAQIPDARPPVDGARGGAEDHRLGPALPHTRILRHGQCQLELNAWFQHLASWTASAPGFLFPLCHGAAPSGRILTSGRLLGAGSYGIMRQCCSIMMRTKEENSSHTARGSHRFFRKSEPHPTATIMVFHNGD